MQKWHVKSKRISNVIYNWCHYNDLIVGTMASQISSLTIVYSTVYSGADKRKHQSSVSLTFVLGIHRWPVNSPHKGPVTRKMFHWWRHHGYMVWFSPEVLFLPMPASLLQVFMTTIYFNLSQWHLRCTWNGSWSVISRALKNLWHSTGSEKSFSTFLLSPRLKVDIRERTLV